MACEHASNLFKHLKLTPYYCMILSPQILDLWNALVAEMARPQSQVWQCQLNRLSTGLVFILHPYWKYNRHTHIEHELYLAHQQEKNNSVNYRVLKKSLN